MGLTALGASTSRAQLTLVSSLENDHDVLPGGSYSGSIILRNPTSIPREALIYRRDALYSESGTKYPDPGAHPRSNASWLSLSAASVVLAPQEEIRLAYSISVPDSDSIYGTYWSVLMVETTVVSPSAENFSDDQIRLGVKFRYAVQVATHVEGGSFSAKMDRFDVEEANGGEPVVDLVLRNDGDRMGRPDVWIELYDATGTLVGRFDGIKKRLYPNSRIRQRIGLDSVPRGQYTAIVIVDAGADELFGAQYALNF